MIADADRSRGEPRQWLARSIREKSAATVPSLGVMRRCLPAAVAVARSPATQGRESRWRFPSAFPTYSALRSQKATCRESCCCLLEGMEARPSLKTGVRIKGALVLRALNRTRCAIVLSSAPPWRRPRRARTWRGGAWPDRRRTPSPFSRPRAREGQGAFGPAFTRSARRSGHPGSTFGKIVELAELPPQRDVHGHQHLLHRRMLPPLPSPQAGRLGRGLGAHVARAVDNITRRLVYGGQVLGVGVKIGGERSPGGHWAFS